MAFPSSSSPQGKYDVFLSFRGADTRNNFTSHLYAALCQKKINAFIDDEELERGEKINPSLLNAIEQSKISLIIFSKGYASSRWCLEELEKILECKNNNGQIVMPVFHNIDPSDVRSQNGTFGDAFAEHEEQFKGRQDMVQRWRIVLRDAANLSGFDSNVIRSESTLVQKVVDDILEKLNEDSPLSENKNLVGVDSRIEYIERLLCIGFAGVRKIGIWGIGGIGKTTLAKVVFNKIYRHFESYYFAENIREESESSKGLADLHQKLIFEILKDRHANIGSNFSKRRLACKKVLIVFDDVTNSKQIESLIGQFEFGSGSRFMITTRDRQVLENCDVDGIYETKILSDDAAHQLFSRYAFRQECPPEEFRKLAQRVLSYANGVPLALIVLGSFLFKRTKEEWESELENLNINDHMEIHKVLKVSYDGLSENQKVVFLDIACFFKGYERDLIEAILNAHHFDSHIYINVLIERCLITTSVNIITMHNLLQEMGREIVRRESIDDLGRRSRLWDHEDILKVLIKNKGNEVIRSMRLNMSKVSELHLKLEAFKNMQNLKFLEVDGREYDKKVPGLEVLESDSCLLGLNIFKPCFEWFLRKFFENNSSKHEEKLHGFEVQKSDFSELRYLRWDGYSANSLPPNFNPKNLVALYMCFSKLKQLWNSDQKQNLGNLKHIDLSYSQHLRRMSNLSFTPNLESLILEGCTNLRESFSCMHNLNNLVLLNLRECKNMDMLSISPQCRSLRKVILSDCSNLKSISYISCAIEELYLDRTAIEELPSLEHLSRLRLLSLEYCSELKNLPETIHGCKSLEYLSLSYSSKLDRLPEGLGNLTALKKLKLEGISVREVPPSIACLNNLETFSLKRCTIENPLSLLPHDSSSLNKLKELDLFASCIKNMDMLSISPQCRSLQTVFLSNCSNWKTISYIPCAVAALYLNGTAIEELPSLEHLSRLRFLSLEYCSELKNLPETIRGCKSLEYLSLSYSSKLDRLPEGLGNLTALKKLKLEGISVREVPPSIACLNNLETFSLKRCTIENPLSLLPHDSSSLNKLKELDLGDSCIKELPSNLGQLRYLQDLWITGNSFESLPGTIKDLSNLRWLGLSDCQRLKSLPELPQQLTSLRACRCISLEEISGLPTSGVGMWDWVNINFNNCYKLKLHAKDLLNIQRDAILWFHSKEREFKMLEEQKEQDSLLEELCFLRGTIFYPGSEISDWFNCINSENFIKLPTSCLNDNFIGFALCVVLSSPYTGDLERTYLEARFKLFVDEKLVFYGSLCNQYTNNFVFKSDLDYVIIGYDYRIMPSKLLPLNSNSECFIKFSVDDRSLPFKLKKCGVRLFYAEDNDLRTDARVDKDQRLKSINESEDDCI